MFIKAKPIWLQNRECEMNTQAKFIAEFTGDKNAVLKITGATFYKVLLNGEIVHYGPAPTAKGYGRVDKVPLKSEGKCTITIEAAGYNCYAFSAVKQTSFICAEVVSGNCCLAATGYDFKGYFVASREQKTIRYSFQRHFTEIWNLSKKDVLENVKVLNLNLAYLNRKAPLPAIEKENMECVYSKSTYIKNPREYKLPSLQGATDNISDIINGFNLSEILSVPIKEFSCFEYNISNHESKLPCKIKKGEYAAFRCKKNTCGLFSLKYKASENSKIFIVFDEKLVDGKFGYNCSNDMFNILEVNGSGECSFESFEIYGFKYFAVFVAEGEIQIENAGVIKIQNPINNPPKLSCSDEVILKIYDAACETARCNFLTIFMDCPTRERAGWLCDSYYSAQAAYALMGNTDIEDDFVENFLNAKCEALPGGMLPMCYPSDHPNGMYIPQWAMWYILELDQYKERNKNVSINTYKNLAYNLLSYFEGYENEYGLLENVGGWNFVEWSRANDWTEGINFPTNMLYSLVLKIIGGWFGDEKLLKKSENVKEKVKKMSYNGKFFRDQALRNSENVPVCQEHISEICQYYAFMCSVADEKEFAELKNTLICEFSPEKDNYKNIEKVNAFIGMYIRMELLKKWNCDEQLLSEIKSFFGHMSDLTGTLWEHKIINNSLNHGFTSYLAVLLLKIFNK